MAHLEIPGDVSPVHYGRLAREAFGVMYDVLTLFPLFPHASYLDPRTDPFLLSPHRHPGSEFLHRTQDPLLHDLIASIDLLPLLLYGFLGLCTPDPADNVWVFAFCDAWAAGVARRGVVYETWGVQWWGSGPRAGWGASSSTRRGRRGSSIGSGAPPSCRTRAGI